jgi:hypothetical protein
MNEVNRIAEAFIACTLPKSEWTHEAHLKVGLWHCLRYSADESLNLLRERIKRYNIVCGVENTESSGYHETITYFYVWQIGYFLQNPAHHESIDDLATELIQRYGPHPALPFTYWSRETLFSVDARLTWVEPDLNQLPSTTRDDGYRDGRK